MSQHFSIGPTDVQSDESVLEGALAVQPLSRNLAGFDTYFKSLGPSHSAVNPWFEESLIEYCKKQHSGSHYRLPSILVSFLVQTPSFFFFLLLFQILFLHQGSRIGYSQFQSFYFAESSHLIKLSRTSLGTLPSLYFLQIFPYFHLLYLSIKNTTLSNVY